MLPVASLRDIRSVFTGSSFVFDEYICVNVREDQYQAAI